MVQKRTTDLAFKSPNYRLPEIFIFFQSSVSVYIKKGLFSRNNLGNLTYTFMLYQTAAGIVKYTEKRRITNPIL
ncbi:MAG: hypothetical protein COB85_01345 [Bacteroidetes bacterium]|nr:MAG: hypothetical protein COB85_01345 [Bacteroidota bacterium]